MTLHNDVPRGFVKHVVRRADLVSRAVANATTTGNDTALAAKTSHAIARTQTSSLQAPVVAMLLGGFIGVFLLFVLIGITCKYANRPRTNPRPQMQTKTMFQPSAAGYGSAAASLGVSYRGNESMHDVSSPNAGLLDSAQPMGRGGRYEEAADSSLSSNGHGQHGNGVNGGFGMVPSVSNTSFSGDELAARYGPSRGGHARGASSGIELPASAASATFRRNVSGSHPPVLAGGDDSYDSPHSGNIMPDGSGFTPGQVFDHGAMNGGAPKASAEMREARNSYLGGPPTGFQPRRSSVALAPTPNPQQRPIPRGPPPASSKNRRSRYTQQQGSSSTDTLNMRRSRIDSVGPGTYRKSMFMSQDEQDAMPSGTNMHRTISNGTTHNNGGPRPLRRVESIGKGDPRRTSRYHPNNRSGRIPSMMVPEEDEFAPTSPGAYREGLPPVGGDPFLDPRGPGGWRDGQHSPYGSSNGSSSPLGPLGPNDPMLPMQQQQQYFPPQQPPPPQQYNPGGGVRMMPYGAGFGAPMPRPGMATAQISSPSSFAQAAPISNRQIL